MVVSSASHRRLHYRQQRAMQRLRYFRLRVAAVAVGTACGIDKRAVAAPLVRSTALLLLSLLLPLVCSSRKESTVCRE